MVPFSPVQEIPPAPSPVTDPKNFVVVFVHHPQLRALRPLQPVLGGEGGLLRRRDAEGADMNNLRNDLMPVG